ncbi:MAG: 4-oxalocrotonate tautomerase [Candidatus Melainabacteria bacterium]|nr:MAG: 4-oxalocrotonate tautomerase [Candidatus Melainabacteria bacterium]
MPFVEIQVIKGVFNQAQKREMITKVTDAMLSVEGEQMRNVTHVVINEIEGGDWGIGGKLYTADDVKALAGRK